MPKKLQRYYGVFLPYRSTEVQRGWVLASSGKMALVGFIAKTGYGDLLEQSNVGDVEVNKGVHSLAYDGDSWAVSTGSYPAVLEDRQV